MATRHVDTPRAQTGNQVWRRLSGERADQILKLAGRRFAASGLASTNTIGLAKSAGVTEAMLYDYFGSKQKLFQAVVRRNSHERLTHLRERFFSIPELPPVACIESLAESTVLACVEDTGNASVMAWGLLEMPEFVADVYRAEIGATQALWIAETGRRFPDSLVRSRLVVHLVPYAVHACMAFGLWLTTLKHKPATAQAHARQYAGGIADAARALLNFPRESLDAQHSRPPAEFELTR